MLVHLSPANDSFARSFILQTICPPFLQTLQVFIYGIAAILLRMLRWATLLCRQYADHNHNRDSFSFFCSAAVASPNFMVMLPDFLRHFRSIDISLPSCIVSHLLSVKHILSNRLSKAVLTDSFTYFSRIFRDLSGLANWNGEMVPTLSGLCDELLSIEDDSPAFVAFRTFPITFCFEVDRVFDCSFRSLFGILRKILLLPVVETEDLVKETQKFESFEMKPREELKSWKSGKLIYH
jgi:hypothetical protein